MTWLRVKDENVDCDLQPDKIAFAARLTLLAKHHKTMHLPHFQSLEYSKDLYWLKMNKPRYSLKEALDDLDMISSHGHMLIKGLLTVLLELK